MRKQPLIIAGIIIVIVLGIIGVLFLTTRSHPNTSTGGSGKSQLGTLILTGYSEPSTDSSHIPLSEFLSSDQEKRIRTTLETLLYKKQSKDEYKGNVVQESVNVNYTTNVVEFKVKVEDPKVTYTVKYNPVNDDIDVLDENGHLLVHSEK